ncbi:MAG: STAS domain-containing protein [Spirochaetes bacterium]|nr:STAS domain-containing protein [Spirochaetota bacterium]
MKIKINQTSDLVKISIEGNLESTTIKPFNDKIANIPSYGKNVEIDLAHVDYIDSSGVRALLTLSGKMKDIDKTINIINCSENIKRILQLSSLQGIL